MSKKQLSLRELDFNNIGQWPQNAKIGLCAVIALVILLLAWLLFVRDKRTELEGLQGQETELRTEFETKQGRAANLEPLKQQLAQLSNRQTLDATGQRSERGNKIGVMGRINVKLADPAGITKEGP